MTNEELMRRYYAGDDSVLTMLYNKNTGLIRSIAKETAAMYGCIVMDDKHPTRYSVYTKNILSDLCSEGALEFISRLQRREYDESAATLTTYLYPHLQGRMRRWLEQNIGTMSLRKDEMDTIRKVQQLYHEESVEVPEIAERLGISEIRVRRFLGYNTHFLGVWDLVPENYEGDPFDYIAPVDLSMPTEKAFNQHFRRELLRELFDTLPRKDRDILGKSFGVFGYPEETLRDIGMYHMMKESAVEKAKKRALKKLAKAYPDSKLKVWQSVYSIMRRPILPPEDDTGLRKDFPQHIRALTEVYAILSEADGAE